MMVIATTPGIDPPEPENVNVLSRAVFPGPPNAALLFILSNLVLATEPAESVLPI